MLSMSTKETLVEQEHGKRGISQLNAKSVTKKDIPVTAGGSPRINAPATVKWQSRSKQSEGWIWIQEE
jgi:hypothetical protein